MGGEGGGRREGVFEMALTHPVQLSILCINLYPGKNSAKVRLVPTVPFQYIIVLFINVRYSTMR